MVENLFFWSGVLIAAVPVLIFGAIGGVLVFLYIRSQRGRSPREWIP